jgi:hypothetical protein
LKKIFLLSGKLSSGKNQSSTFINEFYKEQNVNVKFESIARRLKEYCIKDFSALTKHLNVMYSSIRKLTLNLKSASSNALCDDILKIISELSTVDENFYEQKTF